MSEDMVENDRPGATGSIETVEQLVAARQAKGFSQADIMHRLKMSPRQIEAIERGEWSALPGNAFVRGALRSYGRLIGADVEPLVKSLGAAPTADVRPVPSLGAPLPKAPGGFGFETHERHGLLPWVVLSLIVVVALAFFFGRDTDLSKISSWIGGPGTPAQSQVEPAPLPSTLGGAAPAKPA
ncbi:MAG TPA: helix-turn-helix domain-containing protein, partial [Burkholderiaceae bacterium]|nr:helix-turn-helix domain-containing protein [Burkholderiaceae bacterium]